MTDISAQLRAANDEHARLAKLAHFGPALEEAILTYCLDHPERAARYYADLAPEMFERDEVKYVLAWMLKLYQDHGVPPNRKFTQDAVMLSLKLDRDPWQPIKAVLDRKPDRMEAVMVQAAMAEWITSRRYKRLIEEGIEAYHAKDYAKIDALAEAARTPVGAESEAGPFKNGFTGDDLLAMEVPPTRWLVDDVLSDAGFFVIGGPLKSMKTSALLDLAVSLASGTNFLGKYKVPEPVKVALVTVETSKNEMVSKIKKIAAAKHVTSLANLRWEPHAPRLTSKDYIGMVRGYLKEHKPRVMIVDPLYVSLEGAEHSNIMSMGPILNEYAMACMDHGCIPGAVHHFNRKSADQHAVPTLQDLSQAGCGEFARQWLLMRRREAYQHDGRHKLWMVTGGSDGHSANNDLLIDEQAPNGWLTLVESHGEATGRERSLQDSNLVAKLLNAMTLMTEQKPSFDLSTKRLMAFMEADKKTVQKAVRLAIQSKQVEEYTATISHNPTLCYRRVA